MWYLCDQTKSLRDQIYTRQLNLPPRHLHPSHQKGNKTSKALQSEGPFYSVRCHPKTTPQLVTVPCDIPRKNYSYCLNNI